MPYRYEIHLHTSQSSACGRSTGAEHARYYKALGYDGIFVSDHFDRGNCAVRRDLPWYEWVRRFCEGYRDAKAEGDRIGLQVFFAWEESINGDDWLIYGLPPEWLADHPEIACATRREQLRLVHASGGCVVQAHPFRMRDYIRRVLLGPQFCDAVEVANAGNKAPEDAAALVYAREKGLYMVCGSDNHKSGPEKRDPAATWGVETQERLTCPADWVRTILERRPIRLLCPEERLIPEPGAAVTESFWLDDDEQAVPTGRKWLHEQNWQ